MTNTITETLTNAMTTHQVTLVGIESHRGFGTNMALHAYAKANDFGFFDIRCNALSPYEIRSGVQEMIGVLDNQKTTIIVLDLDGTHKNFSFRDMITGFAEKAEQKIAILILANQNKDSIFKQAQEIADEHGFGYIESAAMETAEVFAVWLRNTNKSKTHLKIADFIEENGLCEVTPSEWQVFAAAYDIGFAYMAKQYLKNEETYSRFVKYIRQ